MTKWRWPSWAMIGLTVAYFLVIVWSIASMGNDAYGAGQRMGTLFWPWVIGMVVLEPGAAIQWGIVPVLCLLYSGPLATAFATWASQAITRSLGAQISATGFLMTPVVGLISGWLVLGEQLTLLDVAAFGLILGGVGVTSLLSKPAQVPPERVPASAS